MTTYRNIHGRSIQAVTTDPTESVAEGQVWYNTTSDTFKSVVSLSAFTSSSAYLAELFGQGGAGSQTSALSFGGAGSPALLGAKESWSNNSGPSLRPPWRCSLGPKNVARLALHIDQWGRSMVSHRTAGRCVALESMYIINAIVTAAGALNAR